jgi:hypothetical protein
VALIPLSSQDDAEKAIIRARDSQKRHNERDVEDSSSDSEYGRNSEDERDDISFTDESRPSSPPPETNLGVKSSPHKRTTSIAQDVIQQKGIYGRFTQRWFSNKGWKADNRRNQGLSSEEELSRATTNDQLAAVNPAPSESQEKVVQDGPVMQDESKSDAPVSNTPPQEVEQAVEKDPQTDTIPLLPKLLTVTKLFFGSKSFFFSYDYDLSRSIANQPHSSSNPLHRTFDPLVSTEMKVIISSNLLLTLHSSSGIATSSTHL